jgi:hypothetical protein
MDLGKTHHPGKPSKLTVVAAVEPVVGVTRETRTKYRRADPETVTEAVYPKNLLPLPKKDNVSRTRLRS